MTKPNTNNESIQQGEVRLPRMTLVCWAAILVATVAGATFAITKFSVSSHIAALQTRLESAEKQRGQDQHVIDSLKSETHTPPSELGAFLPNVTMESA